MHFERRPPLVIPGRPDLWLAAIALLLSVWGVVMVYSATLSKDIKRIEKNARLLAEASLASAEAVPPAETGRLRIQGSSLHYLVKQIVFFAIGAVFMYLLARVDYHRLESRKIVYALLVAVCALMVVVHLPGLGKEAKGAGRWIRWGEFGMQPGELAKAAVVLVLAASIARKGEERMRTFQFGVAPHALVAVVVIGLLMLQRDLGSAVILVAVLVVMLYAGGARIKHIALCGAIGSVLALAAIRMEEYRWKRLLEYIAALRGDAPIDPKGTAWQVTQSLVAFGSGGLFGRGLGYGHQKLGYVPEIHTDFIFSNVGEEVGFIGVFLTIMAFTVVILRGLKIARGAPDPFGRHLALGAVTLLAVEVVFNMGVTMKLLPTKGLALPFLSYGGSSLVVSLTIVGVLLSVSRYADLEGER